MKIYDRQGNYIPTPDGAFETWMDDVYPQWEHASTGDIELWRGIWVAAEEHGRET